MPVRQPYPDLALLQEEYLLIEAWKKTVAHLRSHNWFADTLEIDRASAALPDFLRAVADRLSRPHDYATHPLRLVPAPKSHRWIVKKDGDKTEWKPEPIRTNSEEEESESQDAEQLGPRIRPLAHVDLRDQVAATAIMLCLADRVESLQGDPAGNLNDAEYRRRVLSYGNRLLCDVDGDDLLYHWGASSLYRGYFQDYRAFVARPTIVARAASANDARIVIVQSDLRNFYDRVRPRLLAERIRGLRHDDDPGEFFDLAEKVLTWSWDPRDHASVSAYAESEEIADFADVALPQGLAAAGFFSNVVLLEFDDQLRDAVSTQIFGGARLVDVARYVDDLRIVLQLDSPESGLKDIECETTRWLDSLLKDEQGLEVSRGKTRASDFGAQSERPVIREGDRMTRIQTAVSGGFDVAGGEAILEAIRGLMQSQRWHPQPPDDAAGWSLTPVTDVPDATVARFGAGRFRQVYRWLRPLFEDTDVQIGDSEHIGVEDSESALDFPSKTQAELDNDAQTFSADLIRTWVADPSNIRLLRVAFDIWPSPSALREVLSILAPYVETDRDDNAHRIAQYCLAELFRAGATETGIVKDDEALPLTIDDYRDVLQGAAERIAKHEDTVLPWYLRQQALLFLATRGAELPRAVDRDPDLLHYAGLLRFLRDPASATSTTDFATFSVLARRCFAPNKAVEMLAPHVNPSRLAKIAGADAAFALELIKFDRDLLKLLPEHIGRDLCLISALPSGTTSLAHLVVEGENPFRDELSLLQFAKKALAILRRGQVGTVAPIDLEVVVPDPGKWRVRAGEFELRVHERRYLKGSIYSPPSWCPDNERWRFQLGYLLRFILTGNEDFAASVRPTSWRESRGDSYRPVKMPWKMKRYGFFNAHEAFGDRWLPVTEWTTNLLLDLLAWPGARRPEAPWIDQGISATSDAIQNRIDEILELQGPGRSELLLRVEPKPPVTIERSRSFQAAVVQTVLPWQKWFKPGNEDLTISQRRLMRRHLTAALAAVRSSLRLRRTHKKGLGHLDLLILPELSVHVDDLEILRRFAISEKTMVLAGLVYHEAREGDGRPFVNSAVWLLPEAIREKGRHVRIVEQGKEHLAHPEKNLNVRSFRNSQWLIGYPWSPEADEKRLWLTASVCYDATDFALPADLKGRSDVYLIPALNQDTSTFDQMTLALNYHMFQLVVVANNGVFGGSSAYLPYRKSYERQLFHFQGQPQAAIAYVEIESIDEFLQRLDNAVKYKSPPAGLS